MEVSVVEAWYGVRGNTIKNAAAALVVVPVAAGECFMLS